ncbi:MAG: lipid II flippase MurJ [Novosphingobium sp.]
MRRASIPVGPLLIGSASLLNVVMAVLFQWVLLIILGPGSDTDALFAALTLPQLFSTVIASALTQVLVPLLAGESEVDARRTAWSYVALFGPLFAAAAVVLAVSAAWWVPLLVDGFNASAKAQTIALTQVSVMGILFTGTIAVQQAAAFARGHYIWPDISQALANALALALLWLLLPLYGVMAAAWITLGRLVVQCLLMIKALGRFERPDFADPALAAGWKRMKPLVLGASYYKLDPVIDRFLLSTLSPGSLSLFTMAQQLYSAAAQVVTKALATPAQTRLAALAKRGEGAEFARVLRRGLVVILLFCMACIGALALIGEPVLTLLMAYGRFDAGHAHQLWLILLAASGLFVIGTAGSLLTGAFYARGDTRTPTLIGSASFTVSIATKLLMFKHMGIIGLSLAVSLQYVLSGLLMVIWLQRHKIIQWTGKELEA